MKLITTMLFDIKKISWLIFKTFKNSPKTLKIICSLNIGFHLLYGSNMQFYKQKIKSKISMWSQWHQCISLFQWRQHWKHYSFDENFFCTFNLVVQIYLYSRWAMGVINKFTASRLILEFYFIFLSLDFSWCIQE